MKYYLFSLLGFAFFWNPLLRSAFAQHSNSFLMVSEDISGCLCLILYCITFLQDFFPSLLKVRLYFWYCTLFFCLSFFPAFLVFLIPQNVFWISNIFVANFLASLFLAKKQYLSILTIGLFASITLHLWFKTQINESHVVVLYAYCISTVIGLGVKRESTKLPDYGDKLQLLKTKLESYVFFIQYVSHELRIPLQGIRGLAGLLVSGEGLPSRRVIEYLNILQSSCTQLLITASRVLDFSKFMSEYGVLKRTRCNLREIIHGVLEEMKPLSILQNSKISSYCDLTDICIDGPKVTHIIRNLLANALQNTKNGKISVQAFLMRKDFLYVSIIDTGVGVAVDDFNKMFDKFARAYFPDKQDSSGIGLFIVSYFVRIHKGKIWAEHNTPKGAVFAFILELENLLPMNRRVSNTKSNLGFLRVENIFWNNVTEHTLRMVELWMQKSLLYALIIEDDDLSLLSSRLILENMGFTVIQAKSCTKALKVLESQKVDIVLLDVVIGKEDVHECIRKINATSESASIILQTGIIRSFINDLTLYNGVIGYVLKPYGQEDLLKIFLALSKM